MVEPDSSPPPGKRQGFGLEIGFDLFPPESSAPAKPASAVPKIAHSTHNALQPPLAIPSRLAARRPPIEQRDESPHLSYWGRNSAWLAPLVVFGLGWTLFALKFLWLGGVFFTALIQPGLVLYLGFRAVIAVVVCFLGMKILGDDVGSMFTFPLQVAAATTLGAALAFVVPYLGVLLIEPLAVWLLFCWLLEVPAFHGFLYGGATLAIFWGIVIFLVSGAFGQFQTLAR